MQICYNLLKLIKYFKICKRLRNHGRIQHGNNTTDSSANILRSCECRQPQLKDITNHITGKTRDAWGYCHENHQTQNHF